MKYALQRVARSVLVAAVCASAALANAAVLDFDDLPPGNFGAMPAVYQGFGFVGWFHSDFEYPDGDPLTPWSPYQASSGVTNVFTDFANVADPMAQLSTLGPAITSATPFVFQGAHVSGYSAVSFVLTLGGLGVHRTATMAVAPGADGSFGFLASGYDGLVDAVAVQGVQGYYALDDFRYSAAAVPEPSSLALLATGGMAGLLIGRRRRHGVDAASL